jgi:hypothetical protein
VPITSSIKRSGQVIEKWWEEEERANAWKMLSKNLIGGLHPSR